MTPQSKQRVLVVEDEKINRTVLVALLKDEYQVILAKTGEQALERLAADDQIDLVLLDVLMPDMDGYEVLRRIKSNDATREIPVIFLTALNSTNDEEKGLRLGASDYIGKPFSPAIVKARVSNLARFVRQRKLLETLAGRDGLTEIPNRRAFDQALLQEIARSLRNGQNLSLALIDVDFFKQYNDHYGHAAGDNSLKLVAKTIAEALRRPNDLAARYGGEEFAVILPDSDAAGGQEVAESIRRRVRELGIEHTQSGAAPEVTVSIGGITVTGRQGSAEELLVAADRQLYAAKQQGRNRIRWADLTSG
ncbi:MAG TPA: diguanylate cyclase [Rhodocyclaceae bacterium]|jgi:diguanylate cyclase (GGDEF)-like protein|nr:diguanylate cyclase [Rhodocyclaceae bacterium]HNE43285.1 diguanylate cyclase [Rhodocyclaceae bacterium]HNM81338.1 diguanylate cyclase [Rhodocyclaceae bacterium]HNP04634.1 diguanylate cyclase [Rhodocyclaceae bacterium]